LQLSGRYEGVVMRCTITGVAAQDVVGWWRYIEDQEPITGPPMAVPHGCLMSGFAQDDIMANDLIEAQDTFLETPVSPGDLLNAARRARQAAGAAP
jgi:hypothetical protein